MPWVNRVKELIAKNTDDPEKITFYVGEPEYVTELNRYYPQAQVELIDVLLSISLLLRFETIRWKIGVLSPSLSVGHFTRKVLVVGSASGGKDYSC